MSPNPKTEVIKDSIWNDLYRVKTDLFPSKGLDWNGLFYDSARGNGLFLEFFPK
jgi:hypothetical protein